MVSLQRPMQQLEIVFAEGTKSEVLLKNLWVRHQHKQYRLHD